MHTTLVLGLGNPYRGDDGIGPAVIAALDVHGLPPDVVVLDGGTPGLETILIWQGYHRVIIVDAADMGVNPGTWRRFLPGEGVFLREDCAMQGTLHAAGLAEAVALAEALDMLPPELVIYGVQPTSTAWSTKLSEVLRDVIPGLCAAISSDAAVPLPGRYQSGPIDAN